MTAIGFINTISFKFKRGLTKFNLNVLITPNESFFQITRCLKENISFIEVTEMIQFIVLTKMKRDGLT